VLIGLALPTWRASLWEMDRFLNQSTVKITFDGGSLGNPGKGYGSYLIEGLPDPPAVVRLEFSPNGEIVTNNQAEYRTLISALKSLLQNSAVDPAATDLEICGDSKLVIEQVSGRWKVKHPEIRPLHAAAADHLKQFRSVTLKWHRRNASVKLLGH
jgi:ribonuclease HI